MAKLIDIDKIKDLFLATGEKEEIYAASIGISQSHLSNCINGTKQFSKIVLTKIARRHKCQLSDLLLDDELATQQELNRLRVTQLTEEEIKGILKLGTLIEMHSLSDDEEIRSQYHELLHKINLRL